MAFLFKLAAKPLLLVILSCQFGLQSICVIIQTWMELLRAAFYLHLVILWRPAVWVISLLSLPVRAVAALYRERMVIFFRLVFIATPLVSCGVITEARTANLQLYMQLQRMRTELEDVLWERKELEEQLHITIKECRVIDVMLTELENKHEDALVQIELLGGEIRDLKDEIRRLKEVEGKSLWDDKVEDNEDNCNNTKNNVSTISLISCYESISHHMFPDIIQNSDTNGSMITQPKIQWPIQQRDPDTVSKYNTILAKQRDLALSRSLFSASMTLLIGMIVWEAKDPCMPLILALFTVVAMSLSSVIKFFNTIQHKPTTDAVALLSINWFILGTLMYPTLPVFARVSTPSASRFLGRMFSWLTS